MKLYYAPGTGSLAGRIMLHEAGFDAGYESVDLATKVTETGADFRSINPTGYVPTLVLDDGEVLTENVAVLYWIARQAPHTAPPGPRGPFRLLEALAFIATEVHKPLRPFFTPEAGNDERLRAAAAIANSLRLIAGSLEGPYRFGSSFTSADAYLLSCSAGRASSAWPSHRRSTSSVLGPLGGAVCRERLPRSVSRNRLRSGVLDEIETEGGLPMQLSLKSIVVRLTAWSQDRVDTLYVGCGNRYDDDRRLVRVPIPPRPEPCALHREVGVLIDGRTP